MKHRRARAFERNRTSLAGAALSAIISLCLLASASCGDEGTITETTMSVHLSEPSDVQGPAIWLRQRSVTPEQLVVEVVATGVADLYGVAFRLHYEPSVLHLEECVAGESLPPRRLALGRESSPGELFGALSAKGAFTGLGTGEQVLGTLSFSLLRAAATPIEFDTGRCAAMGPEGTELTQVQWLSGMLVTN